MDGDDNLIKNTYLNLSKPAAFLGASKIHQTLKQLGHNKRHQEILYVVVFHL
jgi:hypothetical protein